jgi:hypothetical protein
MKDESKPIPKKKVWAKPEITFLANGYISSGVNPAHNEATFTFISSNSAHTKKYGNVANAPKAATFTYSHLQHS